MRQVTAKPKPQRRSRGLTKIRKTEIERVTRGIKAAGLPMRGVEVDPASGKFTILFGKPDEPGPANSWDDVLK